ncbi:IS110 family transposase [Pseudomonas guariconensis]|uniref:IS110 family transposase n=1 Tax=Pseudomonas guariconensis TaxID=1288410 RepID=UPI0018A991B7|nr:IS110 family transposase [Pseudomonas guariconensis]MBF8743993.1 IS110 family transposase [Pseudomonas guariconensis]MBF8753530.1 IS110 family transposase [Pseudomonas guariconensis]
MARKPSKQRFTIVHPDCAAIDVGSREHFVAVDPRYENAVQSFTSFTDDLYKLADWLHSLAIKVVAMESTGVYWIPIYEILSERGFEVYLVNARATRQITGRKSDVLDCQWIWQLMTHGLLRGAFRPSDPTCCVRSLVRQRAFKVKDQAQTLNRMQKALSQMNIQLANVISDISGVTGMRILRAIIAGERDPARLAELTDGRIKAGKDTIARSLHGNWRREHLHALAQELAAYDFLEQQIAECDDVIGKALEQLPVLEHEPQPPRKALRSPHRTSAQQAALHQALWQVLGVDLTAIPTIGVDTALVLAGEIGSDLSRFPSSQHFCSWLGLAPPTRISGGRQLSGGGPKIINRAAQALKQAASNARNDKGFIGASHRSRLTRMDTSCAIKATAHQLARLVYTLLTKKQTYVEQGLEAFEAKSQDRQLRALLRKARKLGYQLVAA